MKLLLVSVKSQVSHGGIAVWTDWFLRICQRRHVECLLVNTELIGKRAVQTRAKRNFLDEAVRTWRIFHDLKEQLKKKPQVAHINTSCGGFGLIRDYIIAARIRRAGIPLITHYHCDIHDWVNTPVKRYFLRKLAGNSQKNLVLNEKSWKYFRSCCGMDAERLPNFVEDRYIGRPKERTNEKIAQVLYVGRVGDEKGARELYETARRCPQLRFVLIGESIRDVQAPENVELLGAMPHETVLQRLQEGDVFFFPSRSEGCSVALMEAAAQGLPMVATDVGTNRDIVGKAGFVVPVGDVDAMVCALHQLEDPELRQKMSAAAVENIRENFSETQLDKLFSIIRAVAEAR